MKALISRPIAHHGMRSVLFFGVFILLCTSVCIAKPSATVATTPTVTAISLVGTPAANAASVNFTVTFSESVKRVSTGDFGVTEVSGSVSANVSSVSSSTGTSMTVTVNAIDGTGTIRLDLKASNNITKSDDTGSVAAFTGGETHDVDTDAPAVTGITLVGSPTSSVNTVSYTVSFNEPVTNISTNDFEIVDTGSATGSIASVSAASGSSITLVVESIAGTGSIRVNLKSGTNIADNAGNAIASGYSGELHTVDNPPVVTAITVVGSPLNTVTTVDFLVSFDEEAVNISIDDFELALDEEEVVAALASVSSESGTSVVVTIDNIFGIGPVGINLKGNTNIQDSEGNGNGVNGFSMAFTTGEVHQVDNTGPSDYTVTLSPSVINNSTPGGTLLKFTFSGAEIGASGIYSISSSGGGSFTKELNNNADENEIISTSQEQIFPSEIQTGLSEGVITLDVTLTDATGNTGKKVTDVILKDLTNPVAPAPNLADESDRGSSNTDNITSDNTPTFNGTTEPNATLVIKADATILNPSTPINANGSGEWNFSSTSLEDGDYDITIVATDPAGNTSTELNALNITIDTDVPSAPTLDLSTDSDTGAKGDGITSETILTFTGTADPGATLEVKASNLSLGTTLANISTGIWSLTSGEALAPDNYTVTAVATSLAGEESEEATIDLIINTSTPTVGISSTEASPTNADPIPITVTFIEVVVGFEESDIVATGGAINDFTGTGTSYSFNLIPSSNGLLTVNIDPGVATDLAGNTNSAAEEFTITSDQVQPTVVISSVLNSPTSANPIPISVVFSEPVTGFESDDLVVLAGSSIDNFDGTGTSYTFDLTPSTNGDFTVDIATDAANDAAGNGNTNSNTFTINYSTTAPQVTITADNVVGTSTNVSPIPIRVNFSIAVNGFDATDLIVTGGVVSDFNGSAEEYTFNLTPNSEGDLTLNIGAGAAEDIADNANIPAQPFNISYDISAPSVIVGSTDTDPTNSDRIPIIIVFSEPVTGFTSESLIISGDPLITEFEGSGSDYSFNVTPSEDGEINIKIDENAASDAAGNSNTASNEYSINYDVTAPEVTITSSQNNPTNSRSIPVMITFSESVFGFTVEDLVVSGGTLDNFAGSESVYTFEIRPPTNGEITVDINATVAVDEAGNTNNAAAQFSITYDQTLPSAVISTEVTSPTRTMVIPMVVTFSEEVIGFESDDLDVTGGTVSNFDNSQEPGVLYTFDLTPSADGLVTVSITSSAADDAAGNGNTSVAPISISYDATPPTGILTSTAPALTNISPIPMKVTFSESVTGFLRSSLKVSGGAVTNFAGFGMIYTFDVEPIGDGDITVNLSRSSFFDQVGNANVTTAAFVIAYDGTSPTASISSNIASPTNTSPIPMSATFSEPVTDFGVGDLKIVGGSVGNLSGSGTEYTFNLIPNADGEITVEVSADGANDAAGNGNAVSPQYSITFDAASSPVPTIATTSSNPTSTSLIPVTVTFNEGVTGFDQSDLQIVGGSASSFSGSGASYTFNITPSGSGIITVDIPSSAAIDNIGNESVSANRFSITYDDSSPTTTITSTVSSPTNVGPIPIEVRFNEVVIGFNIDDLIIVGGSASNFLGSGTVYTFDLVPISDGPLTVSIAAGTASDALGNENSPAQDFNIIYDATAPTVNISSSSMNPTGISPILMTVTFSEPVDGFAANDLIVSGGTVSSFGGSGAVYTFNLSPSTTGELTVDIASDAAADDAGNQSEASDQFSIIYAVSNAAKITSFSVPESSVSANISEGIVTFEVEDGTDVTALVPTITISENATITPQSGTPQDFREPVTYTVTAENRTTVQIWTVSLTNGTVLGIDVQEIAHIYPNPAQDRLVIPLSQFNNEALTMMITNLSGLETERRSIVGSSEVILDLHDYHAGMYILRIKHGEKLFYARFIKN